MEPITGWHAAPAVAAQVVAPPEDDLTTEQRTRLAADRDSFLGALPAGSTDTGPLALRACRRRVDDLLARDRFHAVPEPFVGVLRLDDGHRPATAIVGDVRASEFLDEHVHPHEHVRVDRVTALAHYLEVVEVASSPVALAHRPDAAVQAALERATQAPPAVAFAAEDGVELTLWVITDATLVADLVAAVDRAGPLLLADGHHRAAAVARAHGRDGRVLTAAFGWDQLQVLAFHRRVEGLSAPAEALRAALDLRGLRLGEQLPGAMAPATPGCVTLTVDGRWWELDLRDRRRAGVVASLDAVTVERELLEPLQLVTDGVAHVAPVAAPLGLDPLQGPDAIGIALHPPSIDEVTAASFAGEVLPPKTTYVTPRLRGGLLLVPRPGTGASPPAAPTDGRRLRA